MSDEQQSVQKPLEPIAKEDVSVSENVSTAGSFDPRIDRHVNHQRDQAELLRRVVAAVDALLATRPGEVTATRPVQDAKEFLELKFYASLHTANQIREQHPTASTSLVRRGGALELTFDHEARFAMVVLVDTFLFEAGSVRDAVSQLANALFALGVPIDDTRLASKVRQRLNPDGTRRTGLDVWFDENTQPSWLQQLIRLRNTTTHRQVVRLPVQVRWSDSGSGDSTWTSQVHVETEGGKYEPLLDFINRTEAELGTLLVESISQLARLSPLMR